MKIFQIVLLVELAGILLLTLLVSSLYNDIELLDSQLNASVQAKALCEQKNSIYIREISLQNNMIEAQKLDLKNAKKELVSEKKKSADKWNARIQGVYNASCEAQLKQINELQKTFYKERE
jgi:hypothetical protein